MKKKHLLFSLLLIVIILSTISCSSSFTDKRDGKKYRTVKIGKQTWMAENLAYKIDGCLEYDDNPNNVEDHGYLYDWEIAKIACPEGWHLPSDLEWKELELRLGMDIDEIDKNGWRGPVSGPEAYSEGMGEPIEGDQIGNMLKRNEDWYNIYQGRLKEFDAIPSGVLRYGRGFTGIGSRVSYWTSTESNRNNAWSRTLHKNKGGIQRYSFDKDDNISVRCIKD